MDPRISELARLRQPRYQARNFDDTAAAALYEITFREAAAIFLALVAFALYRRRRRSGGLDNTRGI